MTTDSDNSIMRSASEWADTGGKSDKCARRHLQHVKPDGYANRCGNTVPIYRFNSLPAPLRDMIELRRQREGHSSIKALIDSPSQVWRPRDPQWRQHPERVEKAARDQRVFLPFLERDGHDDRRQAELEADLESAHFREYGWHRRGDALRKRLHQIRDRDNGRRDWQRLELYVKDCKPSSTPGASNRNQAHSPGFDLTPINDALAAIRNRASLSAHERVYILDKTFQFIDANAEAHGAVVRHLFESLGPSFSSSLESLSLMLRRKHAAWLAGGKKPEALSDKRSTHSGNFRAPDFAEDRKKIRALALALDGDLSLAYRMLRQRRQLSDDFVKYYAFDQRRRKSDVPKAIRQSETPKIQRLLSFKRGPRQARMDGPHIQRDWSGVSPGQWLTADDYTVNAYTFIQDVDGQYRVFRPEWLVFADCLSDYVVDFALLPPPYNSSHIRQVFYSVHEKHGLPTDPAGRASGLYFERGIWKARLIEKLGASQVPFSEMETGLRNIYPDFSLRHALPRNPRSKTIEGLFRHLEARQRLLAFNVGPREQTTAPEWTPDFIRRVKAGKEDPRNEMLDMPAMRKALDGILTEWHNEPGNGRRLDGRTPLEAWSKHGPLRKLPDDAKYILATDCQQVAVTRRGISLKIRGEKHSRLYCNEAVERLPLGRQVLCFYNLEKPDLLTVSNLERTQFFTVKHHSIPAMTASKEQFAAVKSGIGGHQRAARMEFSQLQHEYGAYIIHDNDVDEKSKSLGRFHDQAVEEDRQAQVTRADAKKLRQARASRLMAESDAELSGNPAAGGNRLGPLTPDTDGPAKTYVLQQPSGAAGAPSVGEYWKAWNRLAKVRPDLDRHALTRKILGGVGAKNPNVKDLPPEHLATMIRAFGHILEQSAAAAHATT